MANHIPQPHQSAHTPSSSSTSLSSTSELSREEPAFSKESHTSLGSLREIQLGFVVPEEESTAFLQSPFFPSKVGGKPAWLEPVNLPETDQIKCPQCTKQMSFLMQIYAPLDPKDNEIGASNDTYHRTLFLFCCKDGKCHLKSKQCFKLFRSQLPCDNGFYEDMSEEVEEVEETSWKEEILKKFRDKYSQICEICGMKAGNRCGGCKIARYCSREHQVEDWNLGHDQECKGKQIEKRKSPHLFKELEIETEEEVMTEEDDEETETPQDKQELLQMFKQKYSGAELPENQDEEEEEEEDPDKKAFLSFQKRIKPHPDQVLRYSRANIEGLLWLSTRDKPPSIPDCEQCGSPRIFEFEILPQLLYYLDIDKTDPSSSLDWGAIVCYTCQNSCSPSQGKAQYIEEYVWLHHPQDQVLK